MSRLLQVTNLRYQPGPGVDIRYPDFSINEGDIVAVEGANGTGKTTLLFLLAGLYSPCSADSIQYSVDASGTANRKRNISCGLSLPGVGENPGITGKALVKSAKALSGTGDSEVRKVLTGSGVEEFWSRRYGSLSTGQQLRVKLVQAFIAHGPLILLDEPTNGLDSRGVDWLQGLIDSASTRGRAVLVTNHDDQLNFNKRLVIGEETQ
ncbi:ABC transporter ATP-binding protein [Corynebacterium striatum]|uniref:ABC transporter ATP-binding protein n=1 Tax=Corynebacterium striatum TaxID=43770 RepID=UPI003B5B8575